MSCRMTTLNTRIRTLNLKFIFIMITKVSFKKEGIGSEWIVDRINNQLQGFRVDSVLYKMNLKMPIELYNKFKICLIMNL